MADANGAQHTMRFRLSRCGKKAVQVFLPVVRLCTGCNGKSNKSHTRAGSNAELEETLKQLSQSRRYQLVVFTKGELLDQENKLRRSGLEQYFSHMETVSNKTEKEYRQLCENLDVAPEQTVMIGNSFRSDVVPALCAGAYSIYIPYHVVWELEKSEEFPHERLQKINRFGEILEILG